MLNDIIAAVRLEIERLGEPCNRTRYFLFGKADELETDEVLGFTFRNAPDRVLRDARWTGSRQEECLFKIGDAFANGFMALSENGVTVDFTLEELAQRGLSVARVQHAADRGIEYVMDTRDLTGHLMGFLDARRDEPNPVLEEILSGSSPTAVDPIAKTGRLIGLNPSQTRAIETALSQRVTFLWGPPGTGKTRTMAALAALLVKKKKRVLLSALSNLALDQLLLATVERLGQAARDVEIARTGTQMSEACAAFGRRAFDRRGPRQNRGSFENRRPAPAGARSSRAGSSWDDHVARSLLVASNFTMLTLPRGPSHGAFDYVLADEVSMSNIPNLAAASFYAGTGMVLGGDPFQLPPIYPGDAEVPNEFFRRNVFETAGVTDRHDPRVAFLDTQYRMQQEIGDLVSDLFYGGELKTAAPRVPPIGDFDGRVVFAQSAGRVRVADEGAAEAEEQRRFNPAHAQTVSDYVVSLLEAGLTGNEIGVITPYNAQLVMIMEKLQETVGDYGAPSGGGIKVSTIHSFQGQERRAIIVDFTDDNVRPSPLTARWELVNVALSRAKELLVIVGNRHYLQSEEFFSRKEAAVFEKMISHAVVMG